MALKIQIETKPHSEQRYPTVGDWWIKPNGTWVIYVSEMHNWMHEICVAIHELAEMAMCMRDGVSGSDVDQFDMKFERERPRGNTDEPGDCAAAPYAKQHGYASGIERVVATALGVDWQRYNDEINEL